MDIQVTVLERSLARDKTAPLVCQMYGMGPGSVVQMISGLDIRLSNKAFKARLRIFEWFVAMNINCAQVGSRNVESSKWSDVCYSVVKQIRVVSGSSQHTTSFMKTFSCRRIHAWNSMRLPLVVAREDWAMLCPHKRSWSTCTEIEMIILLHKHHFCTCPAVSVLLHRI